MATKNTQNGWKVGRGAFLVLLASLLVGSATPVVAQEGATFFVGSVLARRLDREGGPSLGRVGVEAQAFKARTGSHALGIAVGYYPLGRFPNPLPGDYFDETVASLGPRLRWHVAAEDRAYFSLGVDAIVVKNDNPPTSGHDPAIGGFAGFGYHLAPLTTPARFFLEAGMHALAATGELTAGSGFFGTLVLGITF